jgi:hypothetical protein
LDTLRFATVAVLKEIVSQPAPPDLASVVFTVVENPTEHFPLLVFALDKNGIEVEDDHPSYVDRWRDAIRRLPPLLSEQEEEQFIVWETIDDGEPVHALEQPMDGWEHAVFIPWFAHCWRQAGGPAFSFQTTIGPRGDERAKLR